MALACPLHHSLNVLRVDAARNHVALLTVQCLAEARLRPLAKALAPPREGTKGLIGWIEFRSPLAPRGGRRGQPNATNSGQWAKLYVDWRWRIN